MRTLLALLFLVPTTVFAETVYESGRNTVHAVLTNKDVVGDALSTMTYDAAKNTVALTFWSPHQSPYILVASHTLYTKGADGKWTFKGVKTSGTATVTIEGGKVTKITEFSQTPTGSYDTSYVRTSNGSTLVGHVFNKAGTGVSTFTLDMKVISKAEFDEQFKRHNTWDSTLTPHGKPAIKPKASTKTPMPSTPPAMTSKQPATPEAAPAKK